jgi:polysaccharide pyruvyl transferase WcaK-like protein
MSVNSEQTEQSSGRIALLTPYDGGNLGDAAIQDAMIVNFRLRLPDAQFSGISLNCANFVRQHGVSGAFPLCRTDRPFYQMSQRTDTERSSETDCHTAEAGQSGRGMWASRVRRALQTFPVLWQWLKKGYGWVTTIPLEIRHAIEGYRFLQTQDILIVSGGGQLDEEWGGPWGHPFALFKWSVLARIAEVPCAIVSVGACKLTSTISRGFLSGALRMARYRSYRDRNSREFAARLLPRACGDIVVPDLAFSLPPSELPLPADIRAKAQGRPIVAISVIAYAKPGAWPSPDQALYDRYLERMAQVASELLKRGYFLVFVWSSEEDKRTIPEMLGRLDNQTRNRLAQQVHVPEVVTWKDLVASLEDVDSLIASRLHSAILGFLTETPTVAISFDPKVDWLMEDLGLTDYLLQIGDFTSKDVIEALDRIELRRTVVLERMASYQNRIRSTCALQYDALAELVRDVRPRSH